MSPDRRPCRVVLVGMMGSGKSTIGRLLSEATGWPYVDNDDLVRQAHGATSRELLARHGEARMRAAESDALRLAVETPAPSIVGVAAGTILDPADRDRLREGGIVVWLRAAADVLEERALGAEHRPWLDSGGGSWLRRAAEERDPLYAWLAEITLDTGSAAPVEVAAELRERLRAHPACR